MRARRFFFPGYQSPFDPLIELAGFGAQHLLPGWSACRQETRRRGGSAQMAKDLVNRQ